MYSNKMVCCLKANGKVLREFKDIVYVPFGTEYSILIKNLNSVRAQVRVSIDGNDATENVSLVIGPNSETELTRYIKNGNLNSGNSFKFIERTSQIEQYRGVGVEDGLIRIEFQFERPPQPTWYNQPSCIVSNGVLRQGPTRDTALYSASLNTSNISNVVSQANASNDVGITVPGSVSNQQFQNTFSFPLETEKHVMVLRLLGESDGQPITEVITVKNKPTCDTCGTTNKALAKFCYNCGTALMRL